MAYSFYRYQGLGIVGLVSSIVSISNHTLKLVWRGERPLLPALSASFKLSFKCRAQRRQTATTSKFRVLHEPLQDSLTLTLILLTSCTVHQETTSRRGPFYG